ncbi:MAG: NAD(P)-binding domain-containing protein [Pseudomonadota bacterium]
MKIGVIGSGNMGRALGVAAARAGYDVFFGARRAEQAEAAARQAGGGAEAGSTDDAVAFGEMLIWTMREPDPAKVLANPAALVGKIVVDLNNRDYANDVQNGVWFDAAIAERLQAAAPEARVVKAFNTIAMETFDTAPKALREAGAQVFLAGGDAEAKRLVEAFARDLGFRSVGLGDGPAALRAAEALGDVIRLLMIDGGHGGRANLQLAMLPKPALGAIGERESSHYH